MRDFSALPFPAKPLAGGAAGHEKLRLVRRRSGPNRSTELLVAVCVVALFALCGAVYFCSGLLSSDRYYDGVFLNGSPLGGLTQLQAAARFSDLKAKAPGSVTVSAGGKTWTVSAGDISARYDVDETLALAWAAGRSGGAFQRLSAILSLRAQPGRYNTSVICDDKKLEALAQKIVSEALVPERDAALQFLPAAQEVFAVREGSDGNAVDAGQLETQIYRALQSGGGTVAAHGIAIKPRVTAAMLHSETQLLASFTTALTDDPVRNNNIKLAAQAVNGAVLFPGGDFSFNTRTGERSAKNGYADAPAIVSGKLVDAPGGGVCQVATTIYNAALLAGLDISERHHHTWKMSYVDAGLDATVDWASGKDLRLKNSGKTPVYLVVRVDEANLRVTADFYGLPGAETISVLPVIVNKVMPGEPDMTNDPNSPLGTNTVLSDAIPGYSVDVYRIYTSGTGSRKVLVSQDVYTPVNERMLIGTHAPRGAK